MSFEYTIKFKVIGSDHFGYCSGNDADEGDGVTIEEFKTRKITKYELVTDASSFDFHKNGCTSEEGSGYCKGFGRQFVTFKILNLKKNWEEEDQTDSERKESEIFSKQNDDETSSEEDISEEDKLRNNVRDLNEQLLSRCLSNFQSC